MLYRIHERIHPKMGVCISGGTGRCTRDAAPNMVRCGRQLESRAEMQGMPSSLTWPTRSHSSLTFEALRPFGSHHRGAASIGLVPKQRSVALCATDPGTSGPLRYTHARTHAKILDAEYKIHVFTRELRGGCIHLYLYSLAAHWGAP